MRARVPMRWRDAPSVVAAEFTSRESSSAVASGCAPRTAWMVCPAPRRPAAGEADPTSSRVGEALHCALRAASRSHAALSSSTTNAALPAAVPMLVVNCTVLADSIR